MAAIVRNVVNWSVQQGHSSSQIQRDMCEVGNNILLGFMNKVCGKKPKFVERGHKHPYCSRTCAGKTSGGIGKASSPTTTTHLTVNTASNTCLLTGCNYDAVFQGFCDPVHAMEAVKLGQIDGCDKCHDQPVSTNARPSRGSSTGKLCAGCDRALRGGTQLKELGSRDSKFREVRKQLIGKWNTRNEGLPTVDKIYQVLVPRDQLSRYASYRKTLTNSREIRTYHASLMLCDLGTKGPCLCERKGCGICSVVRSSFKTFAFEEEYEQGRFGQGIYTFVNPGLADKEATTSTTSPYRVMIACDVVVSAEQEVPDDDSVFVASSDAINSAYIVMYSM
ncbi:hypothetical protein DFJ43DRAFT_1213613 [Lentinula guzmanii]|uniref:PARP catalytic domain-containing protein n=1 Tax=Lentinula guzmanii TaxID=2804957 RepID=A0AA38JAR3_9AGAR|nr:hypothetical protein DFJ43DRAFT_1213613 [Lentinula guzmanii]